MLARRTKSSGGGIAGADGANWWDTLTRTFNVKDNQHSNLAGDGVDIWGVSITSGSTTLSIAYGSTTFPTSITGKVIGIEGAGVGGAWLITTATYLSPTTLTLGIAASTTISSVFATKLYNAFYGTDDTEALQALILAVYRDGSGNYGGNAKLIFPDALYIINGALKNNVSVPGYESYDNAIDFNSQIYIPGVPPDAQNPYPGNRTNGNVSRYRWSITLEGETQPHWQQTADSGTYDLTSPVTGVRLRSTIQGSGAYYPSIICAKGGGTSLGANGVNNNKFGPDLVVRNMCLQYTASSALTSTMCGINGDKAKTTLYSHVMVTPHNLSLQNMAAPTMTTVGLIPAGAGDEPYNVTEFCNVGGFKYGYFSGEHFSIRDSLAWVCESGLGLIDSIHVVNIDLLDVTACKYGVSKVSTGSFSYSLVRGCLTGEMSYEGATTKWWSNEAQVNDPSNYVYGELTLAPQQGTTSYASHRASKIGGQNIKTHVIGEFPLWATHTGTTYTFQYLYEAQQLHRFTSASAVTLTIPRGDTATLAGYCYNYDIGVVIECMQEGAGQVTPTPASGVTLRFPTGKTKSAGQYSCFFLKKVATNTWYVYGDLA